MHAIGVAAPPSIYTHPAITQGSAAVCYCHIYWRAMLLGIKGTYTTSYFGVKQP